MSPHAHADEFLTSAVRAVTFDGDDTRWDLRAAEQVGLAAVVEYLNQSRPGHQVTVEALRDARSSAAAEVVAGTPMAEVRLRSFATVEQGMGAADAMLEVFFAARYPSSALFPDVIPALTQLSSAFALALVTNGNTHAHRFGLQALLPVTFMSEECGLAKPDPEFYLLVARELMVDPGQVLHVGDSVGEDFDAACRAGFQALLLDRAHPSDLSGPVPRIADLRDLCSFLAQAT